MRPRLREKRDLAEMQKKRYFKTLKIIVVLFVAVLGTAGFLVWGPLFKITDIKVVGLDDVDTKDVVLLTKDTMARAPGLMPASLFFAVPENDIRQAIERRYPLVEDVLFDTSSRHTLTVTLHAHLASFLWCEELPDKHCSYVTSDGLVLGEAPTFTGGHYVEFYGPLEIDAEEKRFATPQSFAFVRSLIGALSPDFDVEKVRVTNSRDWQMYMKEGWYIKFAPDTGTENDIKAHLMLALKLSGVEEKRIGGVLEYIDLRYGNKLYYK